MIEPLDLQEARDLRKLVRLDRYAEILAHVVHFGEARTEEVARRFGLSLDVWRKVDAAWVSELSQGVRRQQADQGLRFSAAFARRRERLAREQPSIDAVGDTKSPAPRPAEPLPAPSPAPAPAVPSFMAVSPSAPASPSVPVSPNMPVSPGAPAAPPPPKKAATAFMPAVPGDEIPLPFKHPAPSEVAIQSAVEHAETVQGPKPTKPVSLDTTSPEDADRIAAIARRVMPFPPGADRPPPLTLEQHALIHAELAAAPDRRVEVLRRHRLTPEQYTPVDAEWQTKLRQDPALRAAWEHARAHYESWLRQQASR